MKTSISHTESEVLAKAFVESVRKMIDGGKHNDESVAYVLAYAIKDVIECIEVKE